MWRRQTDYRAKFYSFLDHITQRKFLMNYWGKQWPLLYIKWQKCCLIRRGGGKWHFVCLFSSRLMNITSLPVKRIGKSVHWYLTALFCKNCAILLKITLIGFIMMKYQYWQMSEKEHDINISVMPMAITCIACGCLWIGPNCGKLVG